MSRLRVGVLLVCSAILVGVAFTGCAVPQPPSGGPRDETPPELTTSRPADGAVEVEADGVRLTFSEYVERNSLEQALSILPPLDGRPTFDWDGRSVEIQFPGDLRANTTYVIELGTDLRDVHGVELAGPIRIAFSTGATIFSHRLTGRVVRSVDGTPVAGTAILAYPVAPDDPVPTFRDPAPYRTQTGERGQFELSYLPDSTFYLFALRDRNRNRLPDRGEPFAPPPRPGLTSYEEGGGAPVELVRTAADTVRPYPVGSSGLSRRRAQITFSEPVELRRLEGPPALVRSAPPETEILPRFYQLSAPDDRVLIETPPVPTGAYRLPIEDLVVDTTGNAGRDTTVTLTLPSANDTTSLRLRAIVPPAEEAPHAASRPPGLRFSVPVDTARLVESVAVLDSTDRRLSGRWWSRTGTEYRFVPDRPSRLAGVVRLRLSDELLGDTTRIDTLTYLDAGSYGRLNGRVTGAGSTNVRLALRPVEGPVPIRHAETDSTGRFAFERVPEGAYRMRFFVDENGDDAWNGGLLRPYHPSESIAWLDSVRVRARWDTDLEQIQLDP